MNTFFVDDSTTQSRSIICLTLDDDEDDDDVQINDEPVPNTTTMT